MLNTRPAKEVVVRMQNDIGALDEITKTIADRGINILAVCAWVEGTQAVVRLVTDDSVRVMDALRVSKVEARETEVLITDTAHKPGMLRRMTKRLAQDHIDIHHLYAAATLAQDQCLVVCATADNDRAMVLLNTSPGA